MKCGDIPRDEHKAMREAEDKARGDMEEACWKRIGESGLPGLVGEAVATGLDMIGQAIGGGLLLTSSSTREDSYQRQAALLLLDLAIANLTGVRAAALRLSGPYVAKERA